MSDILEKKLKSALGHSFRCHKEVRKEETKLEFDNQFSKNENKWEFKPWIVTEILEKAMELCQ